MTQPLSVFAAKTLVANKILQGRNFPKRGPHDGRSRHHAQLENLQLKLYSLPWIRPDMHAWMVDIKFGRENVFTDDKITRDSPLLKNVTDETPITTELITNIMEQQHGSLVTQVERYLETLDANITDRGGGDGGGHLGCWCTDTQRDLVIDGVLYNFKKAIDAGLMSVGIAWFTPRFNGLQNVADAEQFLGSF